MGTRVRGRQFHNLTAPRVRARPQLAKLALTFVALFAFLVQSFITQTHVHFSAQADAPFAVSDAGGTAAKSNTGDPRQRDHRGVPSKEDPAHCPFCQQIAVAGAFLSPFIATLQLPTVVGLPPQISTAVTVATQQVSHIWQGRAPPIV